MKRRQLRIINFQTNFYFKNNNEMFMRLVDAFQKHRNVIAFLKGIKQQKLKYWIESQVPQLNDICYNLATKCYWILYDFHDFPTCPTCNSKVGFISKNVKVHEGYHKFCSRRCAQLNEMTNERKKLGCLKSLGVEHPLQANSCKEKYKATCLNRYGVDHNFKSEKSIAKRAKTWLHRYGYENPNQSQKVKDERRRFFRAQHGVDNPSQLEEVKLKKEQTCFQHYGVKYMMQSNEGKAAVKKTCLERYGVESYAQSDDYKNKVHSKYFFNERYFDSMPEIAMYIYLKEHAIQFEYKPAVDLWYVHDNRSHRYFPDFEVDGILIELKGQQFLKDDGTWQNPYDHSQDALYEAKHQCALQNNVKILYSSDYKKYVDYVKMKHGASFLNELKVKARA